MKRFAWLPSAGALLLAATVGFGLAVAAFGLFSARPATAQFTGGPITGPPLYRTSRAPTASSALPQPISVTAINDRQFVVVTREPRLVRQLNAKQGSYMLVTVVTHYTVEKDGLLPIEDVRIPAGWAEVSLRP